MRQIRRLNDTDWDAFTTLSINAYPGIKITSEADRQRFRERSEHTDTDPAVAHWGLFEDDALWGAMRLFDFTMTLHNTTIPIGGVGGVAVDLAHKKQKVARDMVQFFLRHYREKGASMTALYPFRPDFYRQMGFGYGTKMNQYRFGPASLPRTGSEHVVFLDESDRAAMEGCYGRYAARTHGMMSRLAYTWDSIFTEPAIRTIGYKRDGEILGYLVFVFQPGKAGHFLSNEILIRELVYENSEALAELLSFLHTQADQIEKITFNTQEEDFHFVLHDPRQEGNAMLPRVLYHQSNVQGVGLMYRVVDVPRLFDVLAQHDFNDLSNRIGQSCRVKFTIRDTFLPENTGSWVMGFENGRAYLTAQDDYNVEVKLDIADFSSLVMGTVRFQQLAAYNLVAISDADYIHVVDRLFQVNQKPICMTSF